MDEIKPAIEQSGDHKLTANEFQNTLQNWFDEKGLESDLRSYLRLKMINHLRRTQIGQKLVERPPVETSLSKQAVNLVVADYLLQNNCLYTFSVFNSETNILPEFNSIIHSNKVIQRFQLENLLNILELIGISKKSRECERICDFYYNTSAKESILDCLIRLFRKGNLVQQRASKNKLNSASLKVDDEFMEKVLKILLNATSLSEETIIELIEKIQNLYNKEIKSKISLLEMQIKDIIKNRKTLEKKLRKSQHLYEKFTADAKTALIQQEERIESEHLQKIELLNKEIATLNRKLLEQNERSNVVVCDLKHCGNSCTANDLLVHDLNSKTEKLVKQNDLQKIEIEKLSKQCQEFANEFGLCQSKLSLISSRLVEENGKPTEYLPPKESTLFDTSSDGATEEILKQARLKLKQLELESLEIDKKFNGSHNPLNYNL